MVSVLLLGFLIGLRHALDADHLVAVATISRSEQDGGPSGVRSAAWRAAVWGFGHSLMLFVVAGAFLIFRAEIPDAFANLTELGVGVLLVCLGLEVLWRVSKQKVHIHPHAHDDGTVHIHAHSHAHQQDIADATDRFALEFPERSSENPKSARATTHQDSHAHSHNVRWSRRALLAGLIHGLAGSAALLLLTLSSTATFWAGLVYIVVFGAGSIIGMVALSVVVSVPLRAATSTIKHLERGVHLGVGVLSTCVGLWIALQAGRHLF